MRSVNIQILFAACNSWRAQLKTPCLSLAGFLRSPLCVNSLGSQRPSQTPGLSTADTYHALTPPREETIVQASVPAPGTGRRERRLRRSREEGKKGRKTSFPSPEAPEVCPGIYFKPRPPAASGLVLPLQISKDTWSLTSLSCSVFPWTYNLRIGDSCYLLTPIRLSSILFSRTLPIISHSFPHPGLEPCPLFRFKRTSNAPPWGILHAGSGRPQGPLLCPGRTFRVWEFPLSPRISPTHPQWPG